MPPIICKPRYCPPSPAVPCSKVEQCINKNLHEIIDGDDSGIPDFCTAVSVCTTSFLQAQIDYSTSGVLYLAFIDGVLSWLSTTSGYTNEMAQDAVGGILSSELVYDDVTPQIYIQQVDWTKIVNSPSFIQSVSITSSDVTVVGSPLTAASVPSLITLSLPDINANVGTFNTISVNAKGQVIAASNTLLASNISQSVQSGDGLTLSFNIAHGLVGTPKAIVISASQDSAGISYITVDSTNIIVNYDVAPPIGTNNLIFNWMANL